MNKLFTKITSLALGAAMMIGVGVSVATSSKANSVEATDGYTSVYVLDTSLTANETTSSSYGAIGTATVDGVDWAFTGNGKIHPWRLGGKKAASGDQPFYTTSAFNTQMDRIEVTFGTMNVPTFGSFSIYVHNSAEDAASGSNPVESFTGLTHAASTTVSVDFSSKYSGKYYRFVPNVTMTSTSSNKYLQMSKVEFLSSNSGGDPVKGTLSINSLNADNEIEIGATGTFGYTLSGGSHSSLSTTIWESSDTSVLTVDADTGEYEALAVGTTTITLLGDDGDFDDYEATYDLSVVAVQPKATFEFNSSSDITGTTLDTENGVKINNITLKATADGTSAWRSNKEPLRMYANSELTVSIDPSKVDSILSVVVEGSGNYDPSSGFTYTAQPSGTTITYSSSGMSMPEGTTSFEILRTGSRCDLASITVNYKEVEESQDLVTDITLTPSSATIEVGKTVSLSAVITPVGAVGGNNMLWTSADPNVCTVTDGVVTGVGVGTTVVYANANDEGAVKSNEVTIEVIAGPLVEFTPTAKIEETEAPMKLGSNYFNVVASGSGTNRGYETRGAQFGSKNNDITVSFETTDLAFATKDLRVIVNASKSSNGSAAISVALGETALECDSSTSATLTSTATDYEFTYSGSASTTIDKSNLVKITLSNDSGGVYLGSLKIYSDSSYSNIGNLVSKLHMSDYSGTKGEEGPGWCKDTDHDYYGKNTQTGAKAAFNALTAQQKTVFSTDADYSAAYERLIDWAKANGESLNSSNELASFVSSPLFGINDSNGATIAVIIVSAIGVSALGGFFFLRKRKEI